MREGLKWIVATCWLLPAQLMSASHTCTTCYVDYENGNDGWDGTGKTFAGGTTGPWKHAPGMLGLSPGNVGTGDACALQCAAQVPVTGDKYILKGGVIWPYTALPWKFTWGGSSTLGKYGCAGTGCIYIGYDPAWNKGTVNAITLNRDLGGCISAPAVTFSGGGGSNAAATAVIMPPVVRAVEPNVAGFITSFRITKQGSGYTSNPAVSVTGGSCTNVQAVADIHRPIIDAGLKSGIYWPVGYGPGDTVYGPGLSLFKAYVIVDHLEIRNILQHARACSIACNNHPDGIVTAFLYDHGPSEGYITFSNNYVHGRATSCVSSACENQEGADRAILWPTATFTDEAVGNYISNGDQVFIGDGLTTYRAANLPFAFSEFSIDGDGHIHGNRIYGVRWLLHPGGNPTIPVIINNNEMWLVLYDANPSHVNELYILLTTGTLYEYNNIFHSAVSGASNQQQMGNGTTQYFFNNVSWDLGGGTPNWGIDPSFGAGAAGGTFYFFNNTMYADGRGTSVCLGSGTGPYNSALTVVLQNNHCISNQKPYWGDAASGSKWENEAGSTALADIQAASVVQSASSARSQGYTISNLFAPAATSNSTVTFAAGPNSYNLAKLCSGNLTALCSDIGGNPRPARGGWQAGAFSPSKFVEESAHSRHPLKTQ